MLRRSVARRISQYDFGHPPMVSGFGVRVVPDVVPRPGDKGVAATKLPNGTTVKSHEKGGHTASLGLFVEAGAIYDPASAPGLNYVMRWALMTSNLSDSLFQIDRTMRSVGASYGHTEARKRFIGWVAEMPRDQWQEPLEHMLTCLACPRFAESDVERFRDTMDAAYEELRWKDPREFCALQLENIAFFKEPLGSPRFVSQHANDYASHEALLTQYSEHFLPANVTIAAVNVEQDALAAAITGTRFKHSASAPHFANAKPRINVADQAAQYQGLRQEHWQEHRAKEMGVHPDMTDDTCVALGWLTNGAEGKVGDYATSLVVREVMNLIAEDTLRTDRHDVHFGTRTFYSPFSTAGLVGYTVRGLPKEVPETLAKIARLPGAVSSAEVAKAQARAAVAYYGEHVENQRQYLAQLATAKYTQDEVLKAIAAVTTENVSAALKAMAAAQPCIYGTGDTMKVPSLRKLLR